VSEAAFRVEMPDIAQRPLEQPGGTLDWVGMSEIHQPITLRDSGGVRELQARVQVFVDLADPHAKGIHMSRLYLALDEHATTRCLTPSGLRLLLASLHGSHRGLSNRAFVQFSFDYALRQAALLSDNAGWSSYPVVVRGTWENGEAVLELGLEVLYSSTCPCSAALARQLIQEAFARDFGGDAEVSVEDVSRWLGTEQGIVATPHSQRSVAKVLVKLSDTGDEFPVARFVDVIEDALGTPVQTAVKREDEQEFALRNGQNLMFCEDASRKLKSALNASEGVSDFWVRIEHHESLHAHNAVSVFTKGVEAGYLPIP